MRERSLGRSALSAIPFIPFISFLLFISRNSINAECVSEYFADDIDTERASLIPFYFTALEIRSAFDCAQFCAQRKFCRSAVYNSFGRSCGISYSQQVNCLVSTNRFLDDFHPKGHLVLLGCFKNCHEYRYRARSPQIITSESQGVLKKKVQLITGDPHNGFYTKPKPSPTTLKAALQLFNQQNDLPPPTVSLPVKGKVCFTTTSESYLLGADFQKIYPATINECRCLCAATWKNESSLHKCLSLHYDTMDRTCHLNKGTHLGRYDLIHEKSMTYQQITCDVRVMLAVAGKVCQAATQENLVSLLTPAWSTTTTVLPIDTVSASNSSNSSNSSNIDVTTVLRRANAAPSFHPDSGNYSEESEDEEELIQPKPKPKPKPKPHRNKKKRNNLLKKRKPWQKAKKRQQKKWQKKQPNEQKWRKKVKNQKKKAKQQRKWESGGSDEIETTKSAKTKILTPTTPSTTPSTTATTTIATTTTATTATTVKAIEPTTPSTTVTTTIASTTVSTNAAKPVDVDNDLLEKKSLGSQMGCFEVIPGHLLGSSAGGLEQGISLEECMCICANSRSSGKYIFECVSATYYESEKDCVLNIEDRKTRPESFHTADNVTYLGLTCSRGEALAQHVKADLKAGCFPLISSTTTTTTTTSAFPSQKDDCFEELTAHVLEGTALAVEASVSPLQCKCYCANADKRYGENCQSAQYYFESKTCLINKQNRFSNPEDFNAITGGQIQSYLEYKCATKDQVKQKYLVEDCREILPASDLASDPENSTANDLKKSGKTKSRKATKEREDEESTTPYYKPKGKKHEEAKVKRKAHDDDIESTKKTTTREKTTEKTTAKPKRTTISAKTTSTITTTTSKKLKRKLINFNIPEAEGLDPKEFENDLLEELEIPVNVTLFVTDRPGEDLQKDFEILTNDALSLDEAEKLLKKFARKDQEKDQRKLKKENKQRKKAKDENEKDEITKSSTTEKRTEKAIEKTAPTPTTTTTSTTVKHKKHHKKNKRHRRHKKRKHRKSKEYLEKEHKLFPGNEDSKVLKPKAESAGKTLVIEPKSEKKLKEKIEGAEQIDSQEENEKIKRENDGENLKKLEPKKQELEGEKEKEKEKEKEEEEGKEKEKEKEEEEGKEKEKEKEEEKKEEVAHDDPADEKKEKTTSKIETTTHQSTEIPSPTTEKSKDNKNEKHKKQDKKSELKKPTKSSTTSSTTTTTTTTTEPTTPFNGRCTYSAMYSTAFHGIKLIKEISVRSPAECFAECFRTRCRSANLINGEEMKSCELFRDSLIDYRRPDVLAYDTSAVYFDGIQCSEN